MTRITRILPVLAFVIAVAMMAGCGGPSAADIDATVEARAKELVAAQATPLPPAPTANLDATIEAKVAATVTAASVQPTLQPTAVSAKKPCTLTGGEKVESGWVGKDTGDNSCNSCFCSDGVLGCTKMACPVHLPAPGPTLVATAAPTPIPAPPQVSLPTPEPNDLIHVGEVVEVQREVSWKSPNKHLSTIEIEYRGWSEETIAVSQSKAISSIGRYYTFNALPGGKFVVLLFDVTNTSSREVPRPNISGSEILTEPYGDYFPQWYPHGGLNLKEYDFRPSTPEEIKQFASWDGGYDVGIEQRQTVQMTAIFEIPEDVSPLQAEITSFDRPLGFD